jgi:iron(III) transport system ATP-binding protein
MVTAIAARGVGLSFGDVEVLRGVDLEVDAGEIHVLLGESGSGKTTLLRAIAGFEPISSGTIELFGEVVAAAGMCVAPERRRVGVVFQDYALFPHLDVAGNLRFGAVRGADIDGLLEAVGLGGYARRPVAELSGGEQQRVALARALAHSPRLIVFDEPYSNLNRDLRERLRRQTAQLLREREITALFVTHDRSEAFALADRLSVMDAGRILESGEPRRLYERPGSAAVARALGDCNLIPGQRRGDRFECALGNLEVVAGVGDLMMVRIDTVTIDSAGDLGEVIRVEYQGSCDHVAVAAGELEVVATAAPGSVQVGQRVGLRLDGPFATVAE